MGAGSPIVSEKWVEACAKLGAWADAREHLLSDPVAEKAFGFSLAAALDRAQQALLLAGMRVFLTPGAAARPLGPLLLYAQLQTQRLVRCWWIVFGTGSWNQLEPVMHFKSQTSLLDAEQSVGMSYVALVLRHRAAGRGDGQWRRAAHASQSGRRHCGGCAA